MDTPVRGFKAHRKREAKCAAVELLRGDRLVGFFLFLDKNVERYLGIFYIRVLELSLFISIEIGSKISSFFGSSKEEENKESKVEVRELVFKVSIFSIDS